MRPEYSLLRSAFDAVASGILENAYSAFHRCFLAQFFPSTNHLWVPRMFQRQRWTFSSCSVRPCVGPQMYFPNQEPAFLAPSSEGEGSPSVSFSYDGAPSADGSHRSAFSPVASWLLQASNRFSHRGLLVQCFQSTKLLWAYYFQLQHGVDRQSLPV